MERVRITRLIASLVTTLLLSAAVGASAETAETAVEPFSRSDLYTDVKISPDGDWLAVSSLNGGKQFLILIDRKTMEPVRLIGYKANRQPGDYHWISDDRLMFQIEEPIAWFQPPDNYGEWMAQDVNGERDRNLFGYRAGERQTGSRIRKAESHRADGHLVDRLEGNDNEILMAAIPWERTTGEVAELLRIDVYLGTNEQVAFSPVDRPVFLTDLQQRLRFATGRSGKQELSTYYWHTDDSDRQLIATGSIAGGYLEAIAFQDEENAFVLDSRSTETRTLASFNTSTREITPLYTHPAVDPTNFFFDEASNLLYAVEYETGKPEMFYVDEENVSARILKGLQNAFRSHHVRIVSQTADSRLSIAHVYSDTDPGAWYLYNLDTKNAEHLFDARPWVDPSTARPRQTFLFENSDGMTLQAHLTMPGGDGKPQLVVMAHDGPLGQRSTWRYEPLIQLLAARGYAVLQVDYRGSAGFGKTNEVAGQASWGTGIPQDLIAATRHAFENWPVSRKACLYGEGFGGYAALRATLLSPETFSCVISIAGIYDLEELYDHAYLPWHYDEADFYRAMTADADAMKRLSVQHREMPVPAMMAYGEATLNAPTGQSDAMADTLRRQKIHRVIRLDKQDGFYGDASRETIYSAMLTFLSAHMKGSNKNAR